MSTAANAALVFAVVCALLAIILPILFYGTRFLEIVLLERAGLYRSSHFAHTSMYRSGSLTFTVYRLGRNRWYFTLKDETGKVAPKIKGRTIGEHSYPVTIWKVRKYYRYYRGVLENSQRIAGASHTHHW